MKKRNSLVQGALYLFVVSIFGYSGCFAGAKVGHSIDVRNGTFGKGLEGSPWEMGLFLLGWSQGLVLGIVICVLIYRALKRGSK